MQTRLGSVKLVPSSLKLVPRSLNLAPRGLNVRYKGYHIETVTFLFAKILRPAGPLAKYDSFQTHSFHVDKLMDIITRVPPDTQGLLLSVGNRKQTHACTVTNASPITVKANVM